MSSTTINSLISNTTCFKIILPNFQREFVWDRNQQRDLLASVLTNIPSGSLLLLKGDSSSFNSRQIGFNENISDPSSIHVDPLFLLDGQQRTTSLHSFFVDFFAENGRDKLKLMFTKIHTRWFLHFNSEADNFFGYKYLSFSQEMLEKSTPLDIVDSIHYFKDINKPKAPKFYDVSYKLIDKLNDCSNADLLPLQLLKNNVGEFDRAIQNLAENRKTELNRILKDEDWIPILEKNNPTISGLLKNLKNSKGKKLQEYKLEFETAKIHHQLKWVTDVSNYFQKIINQEIPTIELEANNISKASVIFEYLNKGGTKLTTFDLFTAKFYTLDIRNRINDKIETKIDIPGSLEIDSLTTWDPNWFGIMTPNEGLSKIFEDQFLNTLALLVYLKQANGDIEKINVNHIKRDSILALKESEITPYIDSAINGLIRTYCFLQLKCGLVRISDICYELQILPMTLLFSEDKYWAKRMSKLCTNTYKRLEYYNWLTLFSGRYSKLQNEQSIKDIKQIYSWVANSESVRDSYGLTSDAFKWILNLEDFATESILLKKNIDSKIPVSIERTIHNYVLSKAPLDLDLGDKKHGEIEAYAIGKGDYEIEEHHLIPVSHGKEKYSDSTKEIRKNRDHFLNSILNKALIRKESNRYISNLHTNTYISEIVKKHGTLPLSEFFISYKAVNFKANKSSQINFLKDRFSNLKQSIERHLKSIYVE
jgi:hypothetical protein